MGIAAVDVEIYINYLLIMFRNLETGNTVACEMYEGQELDKNSVITNLRRHCTVGFNSNNFDLLIIFAALAGASNEKLKEICDDIIARGMKYWQITNKYGFNIERTNHIDLIEVAPGKASLKAYGGRLHTRKLQDLPIDPTAHITPEQRPLMRQYCGNDLIVTGELYQSLKPQIDLRTRMTAEYGIDLRSKSDAQIAESVIKSQITKITNIAPVRPTIPQGTIVKYKAPPFVKFKTKVLQDTLVMVEANDFIVGTGGKLLMPAALKDHVITIGKGEYRMGIGGLHSCEKSIAHHSDEDGQLFDRDVVSYYPSIIMNCRLYPDHIGEDFLTVYKRILDARLTAKRTGDKVTADSLKITVNGSFGKFGSMWSTLYAPYLLIQTTITGQLALLMLIEALEVRGIPVVSANTDGVVFKAKDHDLAVRIIRAWEKITGFETEETLYKALYSRDVNNYVAVKTDDTVKLKGAYTPPGFMKNPANEIVSEAAIAFLVKGRPVEETIRGCKDLRKLVTLRAVKGGALYDGNYLGKVVRWYYGTTSKGAIHYKVNNYLVARSEGAVPVMDLPDEFPDDINYDWYITEAKSVLEEIGHKECPVANEKAA